MADKQETLRLGADSRSVERAGSLLRAGRLVAIPTETVYGLAARADEPRAVAGIYAAKGRPDFNPLIVHIDRIEAAKMLARWNVRAESLAQAFWPGPLTIVLARREDAPIAPAVTAGLETIALRLPAHPLMRAVIAAAGVALAAPSANRSGAISPTRAEHVLATLEGRIAAVVDGGACPGGVESTIVGLRETGGWALLRPGPIEARQIAAVLGEEPSASAGTRVEALGQLARHYSPGKPVRLEARHRRQGEYLIGFGEIEGDCTLSAAGDLVEAAARLYDCLHLAAQSDLPRIAVAPIPRGGLGNAINDRLRRAAS